MPTLMHENGRSFSKYDKNNNDADGSIKKEAKIVYLTENGL